VSNTRPLQVYLDSSDFSVLSEPEHSDLLAWLVDASRAKRVEFRFSIVHILEGAAAGREYLSASKGRFTNIATLCGNNCMIPPYEVMRRELVGPSPWSPIRNDGEWFPFPETMNLELPKIAELFEGLMRDQNLSRQQRRLLKKQLFDANGNPTAELFQMIDGDQRSFIADFMQRYPLSERAIRLVINAVFRGESKNVLEIELKKSVSAISAFHDWHTKRWDDMNPIISWLRRHGSSMGEMLHSWRTKFQDHIEEGKRLGVSHREMEGLVAKLNSDLKIRIPKEVVNGICDVPSDAVPLNWENTPGVLIFSGIAVNLTQNSVTALKHPRSPRVSDFGDMLHAVYAPYVDVFRTDAFAAAQLKRVIRGAKVEIVSNMINLKGAIEAGLVRLQS
jgi:hypothetical protein